MQIQVEVQMKLNYNSDLNNCFFDQISNVRTTLDKSNTHTML